MIFYKLLGVLCVGSCGVFSVMRLNRKEDGILSSANAFCRFLEYMKNQIDCFSLPISEIFARADVELLRLCGYEKEKPPKDINEFIGACGGVDKEIKKIMEELSLEFGKSYRDEEVKRCKYYLCRLEERRNALNEQHSVKKKLNLTLCISGCLAVIILFL